jgi:hypothetical protein
MIFQRLIKQSQLFETSHATAKPLRACLFGLSVAGCVGKAAVWGKLLCRKSCCSKFHRLATWLSVYMYTEELSKIPHISKDVYN